MHYFQDDLPTVSMVMGNILLVISGGAFAVQAMIGSILIQERKNNPDSNFHTMKKLMLIGQGLLFIALTLLCLSLFLNPIFSLNVVVLMFIVGVAYTVLNTWILDRRVRKWFS